MIAIRKGSHHSEETKQKIRKNHWSKSTDADAIIEVIIDKNIGHVPWNKDKKMSPEYCEKAGNGRRGKPAWNKGKTGIYSEEALQKMSDGHKGRPSWNKGKPMTWHTDGFSGHKHTIETIEKMSECRRGPGNANWRGGKSYEPYCYKFNEEFKEYIRNKFGRKCFICGISEDEQLPTAKKRHRLYVHHVDYNKNDICNGYAWPFIPLCSPCHAKTNGNRWYWFNAYMNYWIYSYIDFTNIWSLI